MRYLSVLILLISLNASANTILISDIDDTVRQTNTRNIPSGVILKSAEFAGMATLYQQLVKAKSIVEVNYVTGNPLRKTVEFFLFWNDFPKGPLFTRNLKDDTVDHKVAAIEGIIKAKRPDALIMIGDNSEKDPITYEKIKSVFAGTSEIYMHQIYDVEQVRQDQNPWLTSIDLAVLLYSKGHLTSDGLDAVLDYAIPKMAGKRDSREEFFPKWGECKTFYKNFSFPNIQVNGAQETKLIQYEAFLKARCS